jgi:hypothetical protein
MTFGDIHSARDRDALLLAAGELMRVLAGRLGEPDDVEQLTCARLCLRARKLADAPGREREVVHHGQVREEVELLEDDPDPLAEGGDVDAAPRDLLALEEDAARLDRLQEVDAAQECAFPAPARADHHEDLAGWHLEVDAVQHEVVAEALPDALETQDRADTSVRRLCLGGVGRAHVHPAPEGRPQSTAFVIG